MASTGIGPHHKDILFEDVFLTTASSLSSYLFITIH